MTLAVNENKLKEWNLDELGSFILSSVKITDSHALELIFEKGTVLLGLEVDEHSNDELVTYVEVDHVENTTAKSSIFLADIDRSTHEVVMTLTNGQKLGIAVDYQECNEFGEYDTEQYKIRYIAA